MKQKKYFLLIFPILFFLLTIVFIQSKNFQNESKNSEKASGAGLAMDIWAYERAYPYSKIPSNNYKMAFDQFKNNQENKTINFNTVWESLGPQNIGGRTLCLAFHPTNEDIIFAGSASGGLWKTNTQGIGIWAWEYVPTGYPVLGVASIAIDQNNPDIIYIGTGEVYGDGYAEPGTVNRFTRGSYGIGILKSSDGGINWSNVLEFDENQLIGVQDVVISSQNSQHIFAATNIGVFRSLDAGNTWNQILTQPNCIDIEIDPIDNAIIYVAHGNLNYDNDPSLCGIFKSIDQGDTFIELTGGGLPTAWSGSAKISFAPSNPNILYASIQEYLNYNSTTPFGLYKSLDAGVTWAHINDQNIAQHQGWYSHDIAINPLNSSEIVYAGFDSWKSVDSGNTFQQKSYWYNWVYGEIPIEIPEGPDDYVHADIHAAYYHPINNKVFLATDGGVFISDDGDIPFTTLNGGLQTTQFYANMGSSASNPDFCIIGAQDNGTFIYNGNPSWSRVIGADGMTAAVNKDDDQIVYGSIYYLSIRKSDNGGDSFYSSGPNTSGESVAFNAPFELAPSNQNLLYGGTSFLYKSEDGGDTWNATTTSEVDGTNVITKIAVSPFNDTIIYLATTPIPISGNSSNPPKILKSSDGGQSFTILTGLPDRVCKDIEINPTNDNNIFVTFSGFGTNHIYKSTDAGLSWDTCDSGLPDIPTNTILIDPLNPTDIYVGNDLGVYYSENSGDSWVDFHDALPEATMIYDLNISSSNRKVRIATHGHGVFQRDFVNNPISVPSIECDVNSFKVFPNPVKNSFTIEADLTAGINDLHLYIFDVHNRIVKQYTIYNTSNNHLKKTIDISDLSSGVYLCSLINENQQLVSEKIIKE